MKYRLHLFYILLFCSIGLYAQSDTLLLSYREYLGYVKEYHPVAKQAELVLSNAEAELLKARGGFDPKIEVDYDQKQFKGSEYYDLLNATFKIPTWYGIELKAGFEENEGVFLNPERTVPENGLYNAGLSVSVAQGLLIDERRAMLRQAKLFVEQSKQEQTLLVNELLYKASEAYFDWLQAYKKLLLQREFLGNAEQRFRGVRASALIGDKAIIDTVEANIPVQNRSLLLEQARIELNNKRLTLSNYLWIANNVPMEIRPDVIPEIDLEMTLAQTLGVSPMNVEAFDLSNHPKLLSLQYKGEALEVDRQFKANNLLPRIDLEFNALSTTPDRTETFNSNDYKFGVNASFPLFLRKERGALRMAKFKIQDNAFEQELAQVSIANKVNALQQELSSLRTQININDNMVDSYTQMLAAEIRKFELGESSVFLVNSREQKLVEARVKQIKLEQKYYSGFAKLFQALGITEIDL